MLEPDNCPNCETELKRNICNGYLNTDCDEKCLKCDGVGLLICCPQCQWLWDGKQIEEKLTMPNLEYFTDANSLIFSTNEQNKTVIELSDNFNSFKVVFEKEDLPSLATFLGKVSKELLLDEYALRQIKMPVGTITPDGHLTGEE